MHLPEPKLTFVADVTVALDPILELGPGRGGARRIIRITGGEVRGPRLAGRILDVGADWQTVHEGGLAWLDTRYAMETHDGAVIEIVNQGYRFGPAEVMARVAAGQDVNPAEYSMRSVARLETGHPAYAWVNRTFFIGVGGRRAASVVMRWYALE